MKSHSEIRAQGVIVLLNLKTTLQMDNIRCFLFRELGTMMMIMMVVIIYHELFQIGGSFNNCVSIRTRTTGQTELG